MAPDEGEKTGMEVPSGLHQTTVPGIARNRSASLSLVAAAIPAAARCS